MEVNVTKMEVSKPSKRPQTRRSFYCLENTTIQSIRERVIREAPVHAELSINFDVCHCSSKHVGLLVLINTQIQEEVVYELSQHISERYQKKETSVMVSVIHVEHTVLGGSTEPAYVLTITALPEQLQRTLNKRNAFLIQDCLMNLIGVSSERDMSSLPPCRSRGSQQVEIQFLGK